ncbi:alpha/beta hydrolase [Planctomonas deserti]|uniref:alpha/beta hydrolase n=1 Tax=Planctomonas deserti TaxID=2144185 RepID=UPI000D3A6DA8|nr:alpha/beta hydrolase [Planctomonas deserti]
MKHRTLILAATTTALAIAVFAPATPAVVEPAAAESTTVGIAGWLGDPSVTVTPDVRYGTDGDGSPLLLDVCSPAVDDDTELLPAVLEIHGGGWSRGDKAESTWRATCEWLASEGFVTINVNYRLAPAATFPAAIDDVTRALRWLRDPATAAQYGVDPERIGAFGGSAGGNLAALLGTRGSGSTTTGDRVAAVASVSGPMDLTAHGQTLGELPRWLVARELSYLGCADFADCAAAEDASPTHQVDPTDPPVLVAQSADEFIPQGMSRAFADALARAGVEHQLEITEGAAHSTAALDEALRATVSDFLHRHLSAD